MDQKGVVARQPAWFASTTNWAGHAKTLLLFTKSDFKTVLIPQTLFAVAVALSRSGDQFAAPLAAEGAPAFPSRPASPSSPAATFARLPHAIVWIWIHLLVENISNQRLPDSVLEDSKNKPWRPIPAGRLSPQAAQHLLLAAIPLCLWASVGMGALLPSTTLMTFIWLYNDLDGSGLNVWLRNAINGAGLMCFGWGAVTIVLGADADALPPVLYRWIALTGLLVATTVHAQDFPDVEGDSARGRSTVPLLYGETAARWSLAVGVLAWSAACPLLWSASLCGWVATVTLGLAIAVLTLSQRGHATDEVVWKLWCLWLTVVYAMPLFRGRQVCLA